MIKKIFKLSIVIIFVLVLSVLPLINTETDALSGSDFNPGRIIDDYIFYNSSSMSESQIQLFLNSKVPTCDTYGQQLSEFGGPDLNSDGKVQRWEWGKYYYNQTVFTCLKNYKQDTPQMEASSGLCEAIPQGDNRTAAQIVKDVAVACGLNPQDLIVLLQKEQSLVSDDWPLTTQYEHATGFACPDGAPCDPSYGGFFYQVYYAARQFKIYKAYPDSFNYKEGRTNTIYWHPDFSRCGSSSVYIENQATAGLYNYTPYRPNQAALDNLYGTGDSCSSYGNRNFWRTFNDWFGSTLTSGITFSGISFTSQPYTDRTTTATFSITNKSSKTLYLGRIKIFAKSATDNTYNFNSVDNLTILPGKTYTYTASLVLPEESTYTFTVARYYNDTWMIPPFSDLYYTDSVIKTVVITKRPIVSESLKISASSGHIDENITATFKIQNTSDTAYINIGRMKVYGKHVDGTRVDFGSTPDNLTLAPGEVYSYSQTRSFPKTGIYNFTITDYREDIGWSTSYPITENGTISTIGVIEIL